MRYDYREIMADLTQDLDEVLTSDACERALDMAVARYSEDKPLRIIEDFTASVSGARIDPPSGFVPGVSEIVQVEYPIDEQPPSMISACEYKSPLASFLDIGVAVTLGETLRATYFGLHSLTATVDTIPGEHRQAVASYAAALSCMQLSALYSHDGSATIDADSVDHRTKADRFKSLAKALEMEYFQSLGISKVRLKPASAVADLDLSLTGGGDRIFHKSRYR